MRQIANVLLPGGNKFNKAKLIVLHAMSEYILCTKATHDYYLKEGIKLEIGRAYHAPEWLRAIGLSAHKLVTPTGIIIRCRKGSQGAWHASGYNTDSLGIEFLVPGVHDYGSFIKAIRSPYLSSEAYQAGLVEVRMWKEENNISINEIKTHHELSPDRKEDPGNGFPKAQFLNEL